MLLFCRVIENWAEYFLHILNFGQNSAKPRKPPKNSEKLFFMSENQNFSFFLECISLIGLAVGPEKFSADASEVMEMLLKTQTGDNEMADDDPQMSYMISAWARICKILGSRFAPYLPLVMGPIMKTALMKPEVAGGQIGNF